jgi:hypothetical protein
MLFAVILTDDPEEFYQNVVVTSGLFEEAHELFPKYNSTQSTIAADWILMRLVDTFGDDPRWGTLSDDVYDKIVAGLT